MTDNETALNALTRLLSEGDEADRCHCARVLGNLGDPAGIPALTECLRDDDIDVCVDAAEALGRIGSADVVPALIESLHNDPHGEVGRAVTEALGQIADPRAIEALVGVAAERPEQLSWDDGWDDWWDMQLIAVQALGRQRAPSAIQALEAIFAAEDAVDIEEQVLNAMARIGGGGIEPIIDRLHNGHPRTRRRAAKALGGTLGGADADQSAWVLGRALQDAEAEVRAASVGALAQLGAHPYLRAVLLLLRDPQQDVRAAAANAAAKLARDAGSEVLQAELLPLLEDPSDTVVRAALSILESSPGNDPIGPEIIAKVLALLEHEDEVIAASAATLAGRDNSLESGNALVTVVRNRQRPARVRRQATMALGVMNRVDADVLDTLTVAVLDAEQQVRLGALTALMALEGAGDDDHEPRDLVIDALAGRLEPPESIAEEVVPQQPETVSQAVEFQPDALNQHLGDALPRTPEDDTKIDDSEVPEVSAEDDLPLPEFAEGTLGIPAQKAAQSTLDAISIDNVEAALLLSEDQDETADIDRDDPTLKPFLDVLDANERVADKLFPSRDLSVELDVRRLSARILAGSNSPDAIDALLQALIDDDAEVRSAAAFSLETIAARKPDNPALVNATGALVARLSIGEGGQRATCARALAHLKNRGALAPLLDALGQDRPELRMAAAGALAELTLNGADPEDHGHMVPIETPLETVTQALKDSLNDPEPGVRVAAAEGLALLSGSGALNGSQSPLIERLIAAAYTGEGQQARAIGRALRTFDATAAEQALLARLAACSTSGERRFAIEMLDELLRPTQTQTG